MSKETTDASFLCGASLVRIVKSVCSSLSSTRFLQSLSCSQEID